MMTDVFSAFLLDVWADTSHLPKEDVLFLPLLAGRMPFAIALKKRAFRTHAHALRFVELLTEPQKVTDKKYPLLSRALARIEDITALHPRKKIVWDRECAAFAQALGKEVVRVQRASSSVPELPMPFGTTVRTYRHLLGGSRVFQGGTLSDTSWLGRVRAFTQRIVF